MTVIDAAPPATAEAADRAEQPPLYPASPTGALLEGLAAELAAALPGEWNALIGRNPQIRTPQYFVKDETRQPEAFLASDEEMLHLALNPRGDRIVITGLDTSKQHAGPPLPAIRPFGTVARHRSPNEVADTITRKVLPGYRAELAVLQEEGRLRGQRVAANLATAEKLLELIPGGQQRNYYCRDAEMTLVWSDDLDWFSAWLTVKLADNGAPTVKFELGNIPLETLADTLGLLAQAHAQAFEIGPDPAS